MRWCVLCAVISLAGVAASQDRAPFAKTYEDVRLKVWYMRWRHGAPPAAPYRHDGPVVAVFLGDGALQPSPGVRQNRRAGEVAYFEPGSVVNGGELMTDRSLLALVVELKNVPHGLPIPATGLPPAFPRSDATRVFENARVIVWDTLYRPDQPLPVHLHDKNSVQVFVTPAVIGRTFPNQPPRQDKRPVGAYEIIHAGEVDGEQVIGAPAHVVAIELK